jgi:hypothetical protein
VLFLAVVVLLSVVTWRYLPEIRSAVIEGERYRLRSGPVAVVRRPDWLPSPLAAEISSSLDGLEGRELLSPRFHEELRQRLLRHPWVREVRSLQLIYPDRLAFTVEVRRPVARVRTRGGSIPVSGDGVRVPLAAGENPRRPFPELLVGEVRTVPAPGRPFREPAVAAGAQVAEVWSRGSSPWLRERLPIAALDLSNHGGRRDRRRSEVDLLHRHAQGEVRIEWGRAPGRDRWEPHPETKLRNLERAVRRLPALATVDVISVRFDEPYVRLKDPGRSRRGSTDRVGVP